MAEYRVNNQTRLEWLESPPPVPTSPPAPAPSAALEQTAQALAERIENYKAGTR